MPTSVARIFELLGKCNVLSHRKLLWWPKCYVSFKCLLSLTTQFVLMKAYDPQLFKPHVASKRFMLTWLFLEGCYANWLDYTSVTDWSQLILILFHRPFFRLSALISNRKCTHFMYSSTQINVSLRNQEKKILNLWQPFFMGRSVNLLHTW